MQQQDPIRHISFWEMRTAGLPLGSTREGALHISSDSIDTWWDLMSTYEHSQRKSLHDIRLDEEREPEMRLDRDFWLKFIALTSNEVWLRPVSTSFDQFRPRFHHRILSFHGWIWVQQPWKPINLTLYRKHLTEFMLLRWERGKLRGRGKWVILPQQEAARISWTIKTLSFVAWMRGKGGETHAQNWVDIDQNWSDFFEGSDYT